MKHKVLLGLEYLLFVAMTVLLASFDYLGLREFFSESSTESRGVWADRLAWLAVVLLVSYAVLKWRMAAEAEAQLTELISLRRDAARLALEITDAKANLHGLSGSAPLKRSLEEEIKQVAQAELSRKFPKPSGCAWDLEIFKSEPLMKGWVSSDAWPSIPGASPLENFSRSGIKQTVKVGCFRGFDGHCILLSINSIPSGFTNGGKQLIELVERLQESFGPLIDELLKAGLKGSTAKIVFDKTPTIQHDREILFQVNGNV